jgi:hypothetical protein
MQPGTIAMPGEPVAWWCGREAPVVPDGPSGAPPLRRRPADGPRQIYRGLDDEGLFTRDAVAALDGELLAGLPLLTPLLLDGVRIGRFLQPADRWAAVQRRALGARSRLPVDDGTNG